MRKSDSGRAAPDYLVTSEVQGTTEIPVPAPDFFFGMNPNLFFGMNSIEQASLGGRCSNGDP